MPPRRWDCSWTPPATATGTATRMDGWIAVGARWCDAGEGDTTRGMGAADETRGEETATATACGAAARTPPGSSLELEAGAPNRQGRSLLAAHTRTRISIPSPVGVKQCPDLASAGRPAAPAPRLASVPLPPPPTSPLPDWPRTHAAPLPSALGACLQLASRRSCVRRCATPPPASS
jgi:hypothetical protein